MEESAEQQITHPRSSINISEVLINEQSDVYTDFEQEKRIEKIDFLEHKNISVQSVDVFGNLKDFEEEKHTDSAKIDILLNKQKDVSEVVPSITTRDLIIEKSIEQFITPNLVISKSVNKGENVSLSSEKDLILDKPNQPTSAQKELHLEDNAISIHQTTLAEKEDRPSEQEKPRKKKLRVNIKPKQSVKVREVLLSENELKLKLKEPQVQDDKAKQTILEEASLNIYTSKILEKESIQKEKKPKEDSAKTTQDQLEALTINQVLSSHDIENLEISAQNIQTISLGLTEKKVTSKDEEIVLEKEQQLKAEDLDSKRAETSIDQDKALSIQFKNVLEQTNDFNEFRPEFSSANLNLSKPTFKSLVISDICTSETAKQFKEKPSLEDQAIEKELIRKHASFNVDDKVLLEKEDHFGSEDLKESSAKQDLTFINLPTNFKQDFLEDQKDFEIEQKLPSQAKTDILFNESSNVTEIVLSLKEQQFITSQPKSEEADQDLIPRKSINIKSSLPLQSLKPFDSEKTSHSTATTDLEVNRNILLIGDSGSNENETEFELKKPKKIKKLPKFLTKEAIVVKQIETSDLEDQFNVIKNEEKNASKSLLPFESVQVKDDNVNEKETQFFTEPTTTSTLDNRSIERHSAISVQQTLSQRKEIDFEILQNPEETASIDVIGQKVSSVKSDNLLEKEKDFSVQKPKQDSATKNLTFKKALQSSQATGLVKESEFRDKIKKKKTKPKLDESSLISCEVTSVTTVENSELFKTEPSKPGSAKLNISESEAVQIEYKVHNDKENRIECDQKQPSNAKLNKELRKGRPLSIERHQTFMKEDILKPDEIKKQMANQELVTTDVNVIDIQDAIEKEGLLFEKPAEDRILRIIIKEKEYHEKIIKEQPHSYIRREGEEILIEEKTVVMIDQPEIIEEEVKKKIKIKPKSKRKEKVSPVDEQLSDRSQDTSKDIEEEFISIEQLPESELSEKVSLKTKKPSKITIKLPDVFESKTVDIEKDVEQVSEVLKISKKKSIDEEKVEDVQKVTIKTKKKTTESVILTSPLVTEEGLVQFEQAEDEIESIKIKPQKKKSIVEEAINLVEPTESTVTIRQETTLEDDKIQEEKEQVIKKILIMIF